MYFEIYNKNTKDIFSSRFQFFNKSIHLVMHTYSTLANVALFAHSEVISVPHLVLITCLICLLSVTNGLNKQTIIQNHPLI